MNIKFEIKKMYTNISQEEYLSGVEELKDTDFIRKEVVIFNKKEFPPYIYETIDNEPYRFDGYDITTTIDGYDSEAFTGFFQPTQTAQFVRVKEKVAEAAKYAFEKYNSTKEQADVAAKWFDKYKIHKKSLDFYTLLLEELKKAT